MLNTNTSSHKSSMNNRSSHAMTSANHDDCRPSYCSSISSHPKTKMQPREQHKAGIQDLPTSKASVTDCKSAKVPLLSPETVVSKSIPGALARSASGPTQFNAYCKPWPKNKNVSSCAPGVFVRGEPSPVYRSTSKTPSKDKGCVPKTPYDPVKSLQKMRFTSALKKYRYEPKRSSGESKTSPYHPQVNSDDDAMDADVKSNGQSRRFQRWDPDEDDLLRFAIKQEKGNMHDWKAISEEFFGGARSAHQCKARWKNALSPDINRLPFSLHEDAEIVRYQSQGLSWPAIASQLPGRVAEQVRDRFINYLDSNRKMTEWTKEEDELLTKLQRSIGNKWTEMSQLIPGRTESSIKNRWHNRKTKQRRAFRRMALEKQKQLVAGTGPLTTPSGDPASVVSTPEAAAQTALAPPPDHIKSGSSVKQHAQV